MRYIRMIFIIIIIIILFEFSLAYMGSQSFHYLSSLILYITHERKLQKNNAVG